jgi:hypothetical protein
MIGRLRTIFSNAKFSAGSASPKTADEAFLRELADLDIFVIAGTQGEGIDAGTMTKEQLLTEIRRALERDRENQQKGYTLFVYSVAGKRRLPFFTSNEHAQRFCGEYSKVRKRVFPFTVLQVKGTFLGKVAPSSCDVVVLNDKSSNERVLSDVEMTAARRMWG